jgi:hypothetical protein
MPLRIQQTLDPQAGLGVPIGVGSIQVEGTKDVVLGPPGCLRAIRLRAVIEEEKTEVTGSRLVDDTLKVQDAFMQNIIGMGLCS